MSRPRYEDYDDYFDYEADMYAWSWAIFAPLAFVVAVLAVVLVAWAVSTA